MNPDRSQNICPAHHEIVEGCAVLAKECAVQKESIDNLKRSADAVWDKLDDYGRVLHDMNAAIQRIDGFLNGRKNTDQAISHVYDRAISIARLMMYLIFSGTGILVAILKLIVPLLNGG